MANENIFITNCLDIKWGKKQTSHVICLWSRLVAVDTLVLLHPAPPQRLDVFGSEPAVSGQRGLTLAQRQQPTDRFAESHISVLISCQSETIYEMYERVQKKKEIGCAEAWSYHQPVYGAFSFDYSLLLNTLKCLRGCYYSHEWKLIKCYIKAVI